MRHHGAGRPQHGAVAAEADDEIRPFDLLLGSMVVPVRRLPHLVHLVADGGVESGDTVEHGRPFVTCQLDARGCLSGFFLLSLKMSGKNAFFA